MRKRIEAPIAPVAVSERTCEPTMGLAPWRFRAICAEHHIGARVGNTLIVRVDDLLAALGLDGKSSASTAAAAAAEPVVDGVDQVLAAVGRRRA